MFDTNAFNPSSEPLSLPQGTGLSLATEIDPERFRNMIHSHPARQRIRVWRAMLDPGSVANPATREFIPSEGHPRGGNSVSVSGVRYIEQPGALQYPALIQTAGKNAERYFAAGTLPTGALSVTTLPDQLPLSSGDVIAPWGKSDSDADPERGPGTIPNAAFQTGQALMERGRDKHLTPLPGIVTIEGRTMTGMGTNFTQTLFAGDVLRAMGETAVVARVDSDTSLLLADGEFLPETPWNGVPVHRADDCLPEGMAFSADQVLLPSGALADPGTFRLSPGGDRVLWSGLPGIAAGVPAPGTTYSLLYRFFPRYQVQGDLSQQAPPVSGKVLPQTVICTRIAGVLR